MTADNNGVEAAENSQPKGAPFIGPLTRTERHKAGTLAALRAAMAPANVARLRARERGGR